MRCYIDHTNVLASRVLEDARVSFRPLQFVAGGWELAETNLWRKQWKKKTPHTFMSDERNTSSLNNTRCVCINHERHGNSLNLHSTPKVMHLQRFWSAGKLMQAVLLNFELLSGRERSCHAYCRTSHSNGHE